MRNRLTTTRAINEFGFKKGSYTKAGETYIRKAYKNAEFDVTVYEEGINEWVVLEEGMKVYKSSDLQTSLAFAAELV